MKDMRIKANGIHLQVQDSERDGPAVVLLHHGGGSMMMWRGVTPYLEDAYRLLLFDLRGHGRSDKPPSGYHIDDENRRAPLVE